MRFIITLKDIISIIALIFSIYLMIYIYWKDIKEYIKEKIKKNKYESLQIKSQAEICEL